MLHECLKISDFKWQKALMLHLFIHLIHFISLKKKKLTYAYSKVLNKDVKNIKLV